MSSALESVLYTAKTTTSGGRTGSGKSSDGQLEVNFSSPGSGKPGTNPEQLFALGYSACFIGAIQVAAGKQKVKLPEDTSVEAEVDLGKVNGGADFQLAVRLNVSIPGLDDAAKKQLVDAAHEICPYSRMTRGHVDVEVKVV
ncbi:organic hydroperoxide resistance protein [Pseudomonas sp. SZMC_28357]|uniref:organic hydroperoxide resistance protein n=1 Tax=Pseudomonas sp. SZMC_28357 TaxID=3074380 RepID=UPI002871BE03|nr:organic hydroperoxide resistance protein [Pseudomonas sp. SZMC_28357]MDR9753178.1 organic hydroperoxide resistance protein [Pseudomonas sp. SZMC_28357]